VIKRAEDKLIISPVNNPGILSTHKTDYLVRLLIKLTIFFYTSVCYSLGEQPIIAMMMVIHDVRK
jgi:hypothetical protein